MTCSHVYMKISNDSPVSAYLGIWIFSNMLQGVVCTKDKWVTDQNRGYLVHTMGSYTTQLDSYTPL